MNSDRCCSTVLLFTNSCYSYPVQVLVSAEPEVVVHTLESERAVVLACDGIFDVMTDTAVAQHLNAAMEERGEAVRGAAAGLLKQALSLNSTDNLTAIVASFAWPDERSNWMEAMRVEVSEEDETVNLCPYLEP